MFTETSQYFTYGARWRRLVLALSTLPFFSLRAYAQPEIKRLAETRHRLVLPTYSAQERQLLADQALMVIKNLYVNRDIKVEDFGASFDPVPRLERLSAEASYLDNEVFHSQLAAIFSDLHDLHTNYKSPAPLACGAVFFPLRFEGVENQGSKTVVVSKRLGIGEEYTEGLQAGDELLAMDGEPIQSILRKLERVSGGANADAMYFRATELLSMRSLKSQSLPAEDEVTFTFRTVGGVVEKTIPWFSWLDTTCLRGAQPEHHIPLADAMVMAHDEYQEKYNRIFGKPRLVGIPRDEEEGPIADIFEVTEIKTPAGILGYIDLKTFYWNDRSLETGTVIEAFRRSVEAKLINARAIVIDVRNNPGGLIVFAERLLQLFSPQGVEPSTVRLLANELNEAIFVRANKNDNRWSKVVREAMARGQRYTKPIAITPLGEANAMGQVWFRPLVVLTNAGCYSACDLFSAGIQDNRAGVIIGTHKRTGAGGANVMEYATFQKILADATYNPFKPLPYGQGMRVSWRQVVRSGVNTGKLIENEGVVSDIIVPLTAEDVGTESRQLMHRIHETIDQLQPYYRSHVAPRRGGYVFLKNGEPAVWRERLQGVDQLRLTSGGRVLYEFDISYSEVAQEVEVGIPGYGLEWQDRRVALTGFRAGKQVFRVVRVLSWRGDYLDPGSGIGTAFDSGDTSPLRTYVLSSSEEAGWQVEGGKLRIGYGATYDGNVLARALLPLAMQGRGGRLSFEIELEAEELYDSLRLYAINPRTGDRHNFFAGHSTGGVKNAELELPRGWEKMDLIFEFESDENWHFKGPRLDNLVVRPLP